jgi:AraC-like DNA-binding protein
MQPITDFLSHGSIALLLLGLLLALRESTQFIQARLLACLALSLIALIASRIPDIGGMGSLGSLAIGLVAAPNVGLLWLFCLSLLRDDFRMGARQWFGLAALTCVPLSFVLTSQGFAVPAAGWLDRFGFVPPFLMLVHILWVALSERSDDLVEARRRGRLWIVLAVSVAAVVSLVSESLTDRALSALIRDGLATFPAVLFLLLWLTGVRVDRLTFTPSAPAPAIDPRDAHLHQRLLAAMADERLYLESGLSIGSLATRLSVPEHQLRTLINGAMGHRNFAAFLNGYRLDAAKLALADPARARETVLAIAFETGFSSLQTFNRVFRDTQDMTPTDFRAAALGAPPQN